ncbi:Hypothetical protein Ccan_09830 [Capnocytophaga canimorsus Cc5]|uniref:Uncharacterized protein n=1 Tax=Capnocytophaga canimorsus (strain 5) TaxID=860228 RepID=F9YUX6_CAPCC|nr:hypothetical protein [Capnocytophaga canimorsus]AEK23101.1 Hypothetical protein Ccan_09830 [Capnocytophaga canimorsus Cc5]
MITKERFSNIYTEIETAIKETFKSLSENCPNEFALFLANAEYVEKYEKTKVFPYVIDYIVDEYREETREQFLIDFLNRYYSFKEEDNRIENDNYRRNIELMIYTHIWEATNFLKYLHRLSYLVKDGQYQWKVEIPDMQKYKFIQKIKSNLSNNNLSNIIERSYHSSLRNAFAHSQYIFHTMNGEEKIKLLNYGDEKWELEDISFNDWTERFVNSFLLNYLLYKIIRDCRKNINPSTQFSVNINTIMLKFRYNEQNDSFSFER